MKTPTLPLTLYKANLDLWLRVGELLEENRDQWTALMTRELQGSVDAGFDVEALRRGDWQTLALQPGQVLQRMAAHGVGDLQAAAQTALGNQMTFATGFQQALADWQQATLDALGDAAGGVAGADAQALFGQALQDLMAWPDALAGRVPGATPRATKATKTASKPQAGAGADTAAERATKTRPATAANKAAARGADGAPAKKTATRRKTAKRPAR